MRTVWKFRAGLDGRFTVDVGAPGSVVMVAAQDLEDIFPTLWVEHDTEAEPSPRTYQCFGTGAAIPYDVGPFVGSAVCAGGALVWHVYRVLG